jgi:hypothetical protein
MRRLLRPRAGSGKAHAVDHRRPSFCVAWLIEHEQRVVAGTYSKAIPIQAASASATHSPMPMRMVLGAGDERHADRSSAPRFPNPAHARGFRAQFIPCETLVEARDAVVSAQHLIIVFSPWYSGMSALLKLTAVLIRAKLTPGARSTRERRRRGIIF